MARWRRGAMARREAGCKGLGRPRVAVARAWYKQLGEVGLPGAVVGTRAGRAREGDDASAKALHDGVLVVEDAPQYTA